MFQRLKSIEHSPILNFVKSKKRTITALSLASLSAATLAITTGIAPVRLAGVSNVEKASAYQSYSAWWGYYYFLNASEARNLAGRLRQTGDYVTAFGIVTGFYPQVSIPVSLYGWKLNNIASTLDSCANSDGHAYYKLYRVVYKDPNLPILKTVYAPDASCN
jgi:hypothetical protein